MVLLFSVVAYSSLSNSMEKFAQKTIQSLDLHPESNLHISLLEKDRNYMLDLSGVYELLREKFVEKLSGKQVVFRSIDGTASAVIYDLLQNQQATSSLPADLDTLILSGSYDIVDSSTVYCTIEISTTTAQRISKETFILTDSAVPPSLLVSLFHPIKNTGKREEIEFRGKIINKMDRLINSTEGNLFYGDKYFRFVKKNPYANIQEVDLLKEILIYKYGVLFTQKARATISVGYYGLVEIQRDGKTVSVGDLISGEALFPQTYVADMKKLEVPVQDPVKQQVTYESRAFKPSEKYVRNRIISLFESDYPAYFTHFNPTELRTLFNKGASILVGNVQKRDHTTGVEQVAYKWITSENWISALESQYNSGRRFVVSTDIMKVFQDTYAPNRYWAIVKQEWQTTFEGKRVYRDTGFLCVHFDFTTDKTKLVSFHIAYRLWFYSYQFKELETGLTRADKLKQDLDIYFFNEKSGVSGINHTLKKQMQQFLIEKIDEVDKRLILQQ